MEYIKEITSGMIGWKVKGEIRNKPFEGEISRENNDYFILQNVECGKSACDLKGYKYSWSIISGSESNIRNNNVTCLLPSCGVYTEPSESIKLISKSKFIKINQND